MAPLSRERFHGLVGRLDEDALAEFVAALWRARGHAVEREGRLLVVTGTAERRLYVDTRGPWPLAWRVDPPPEADVVVTARREAPPGTGERRVVDADDLYEMALYGVDRDACEAAFRRAFGGPPDEFDGTGRRRVATGAVLAVAVATLAAVLVVTGGAFLDAGPGGTDGGDRLAADARGVFDVPAPNGRIYGADGAPVGGALVGTATTREAETLAPGLAPGGVVDAAALAAAHADGIEGRAYRLELVYREFVAGNRTARASETARVEPDAPATRVVEVEGDLRRDPLVVAAPVREGYPGGWHHNQESYAARVERYVGWFLSVEESTVTRSFIRDGRRVYVVELLGEPWPGATDVTGTAVVDERGVVHALRRSGRVPGTNVSTAVAIRYEFADRRNASVAAGGPVGWADE